MKQPKVIIVGGGAAGFFCAIHVAQKIPHAQVIILEKTSKLLSKVKISGGGRCNVTHHCFENNKLVKHYPRGQNFLKKIFNQFSVTDTIAWFEKRGVQLKTEADGRMFPASNSSQSIIDCLLSEASKLQIKINMHTEVVAINKLENGSFILDLKNNNTIEADYLCIAGGGYNKLSAYNFLSALGIDIIPPTPSLFSFNIGNSRLKNFMGVSVPHVQVKITGTKLVEQGPLMITHWGLSGPAILRLSAWGAKILAEKNWNFSIMINWVPEYNEESLRQQFSIFRNEKAAQLLHNKNPFQLPASLWAHFLISNDIATHIRWSDLPAKRQNTLIKTLCAHEIEVNGKTTFKEEFVTAGGVDLSTIDSSTMMSRKISNLYFAGEIIDVDGITGGFNFQNAWTTGFIAAQSIASNIEKKGIE